MKGKEKEEEKKQPQGVQFETQPRRGGFSKREEREVSQPGIGRRNKIGNE